MTRPRPTRLLPLTVLLLVLAGCGSTEPEPPDPDGGSPSSSAPSVPSTPSSSSSPSGSTEEETEEETEGATAVEPATGPRVEVPGLRLRTPEGTRASELGDSLRFVEYPDTAEQFIEVASLPYYGSTLREQARIQIARSPYPTRPTMLDNIEYAGQRWWHIRVPSLSGGLVHTYGTTSGEVQVYLNFAFERGTRPAEARAVVDSVMATAELTG